MNDVLPVEAMLKQSEQAAATNTPLAYQLLASAAICDSNHVEAWWRLGQTHWNSGMRDAAAACYRRALQCPGISDDMREKVHCNLGHVLHHLGKNDEAREHALIANLLNPKQAFNYCNLSLIESVDGRLDKSLEYARKAYDMDPNNAAMETALAFALLYKRQWIEGLRHFNGRFGYRLPQFANYPYPMWKGEPDKVVYCVSEQGIGDTLSYSRFIPRAVKHCKFMHLGVHSESARLLRAVFQDIPNINILPQPCPFPPATAWTTFMSLPPILGMTDAEFEGTPNIPVPAFRVEASKWKDKHAKLHIGISWAGSAANDINHWRSIPVTEFLRLYEVPGIQLYSLQMDDHVQDIHRLGLATLVRDMKPHVRDLADTTAIVRELDIIICAEGLLGHIAGAVGKPCWIAYSWMGRSFHIGHDGKDVPFYPDHVVFKQGPDMLWGPVFDNIVAALDALVNPDDC